MLLIFEGKYEIKSEDPAPYITQEDMEKRPMLTDEYKDRITFSTRANSEHKIVYRWVTNVSRNELREELESLSRDIMQHEKEGWWKIDGIQSASTSTNILLFQEMTRPIHYVTKE